MLASVIENYTNEQLFIGGEGLRLNIVVKRSRASQVTLSRLTTSKITSMITIK